MSDCQWRDIETAPKDGTVVMFHVPECRLPFMARSDDWHSGYAHWLKGATHWMPLPAPPTGASQ